MSSDAQEQFNAKHHFSSRLAEAVEKDGRTKTAIAKSMDTQPPALSRWLGGVIPDPENLSKLAKTLNVSVQWLLTGDGNVTREEPALYKITSRIAAPTGSGSSTGPNPQPQTSRAMLSTCQFLLTQFEHINTPQALDWAVAGLHSALDQYRALKLEELQS
jgi:transcriptional regulator with XRE-family HTH domain